MTTSRGIPHKDDLPYWKFRGGQHAPFRLHGDRWWVTRTNREGRALEVHNANGTVHIYFPTLKAWQGWVTGDWRYV